MKRIAALVGLALVVAFALPGVSNAAATTAVSFIHAYNPSFDTNLDVYLDDDLVQAGVLFGDVVPLGDLDQGSDHTLTLCYHDPAPPATLPPSGCPNNTARINQFTVSTSPVQWEILADNGDGFQVVDLASPTTCPAQGSGAVEVFNAGYDMIDATIDGDAVATDLDLATALRVDETAGSHLLSAAIAGGGQTVLKDAPFDVTDQVGTLAIVAFSNGGNVIDSDLLTQSFPMPCQVATTTTTSTSTTSTTTAAAAAAAAGAANAGAAAAVTAGAAYAG